MPQKVFPHPTVRAPSASNSPSALSAQALRARALRARAGKLLRNLGDEGIGIRGGGVDWFTGRVVGEMGDGEEMAKSGEEKEGK